MALVLIERMLNLKSINLFDINTTGVINNDFVENNLPHADVDSLESSVDKCIMQTVGNCKLGAYWSQFFSFGDHP